MTETELWTASKAEQRCVLPDPYVPAGVGGVPVDLPEKFPKAECFFPPGVRFVTAVKGTSTWMSRYPSAHKVNPELSQRTLSFLGGRNIYVPIYLCVGILPTSCLYCSHLCSSPSFSPRCRAHVSQIISLWCDVPPVV